MEDIIGNELNTYIYLLIMIIANLYIYQLIIYA